MKSKYLTIGLFAHVDSGKTSLAEALLVQQGAIKSGGRVDHKDSFLDTDEMEKDRGITIFSKEASLTMGDYQCTLVDNPGHEDFIAEADRTLPILDMAILLLDGSDEIRPYTQKCFKKLEGIPTIVFVNKMDLVQETRADMARRIANEISPQIVDLEDFEHIANLDDGLLEEYLDTDTISENHIIRRVGKGVISPLLYGSALKGEGIDRLVELIGKVGDEVEPCFSSGETNLYPYKVTYDDKGNRLTHCKILSGTIKVKDETSIGKVQEIRKYSGDKYETKAQAVAGELVAMLGLKAPIGNDSKSEFAYELSNFNVDNNKAFEILNKMAEEEPSLNPKAKDGKIYISIKGEIQKEVIANIAQKRYGLSFDFGKAEIEYRESIKDSSYGMGHYEPLRHFAEVHIYMEPSDKLEFESNISEDVLDLNWQRLIMTHLKEKTFVGPLTGSPICNMKLSVVAGKAHLKHTEGGDFRQATYRAVSHGLRMAEQEGNLILLEPWSDFVLIVPSKNLGNYIGQIKGAQGRIDSQEASGDMTKLRGHCPLLTLIEIKENLAVITSGKGLLNMEESTYEPCHNGEEVIKEKAYDADRDLQNTADSIFCKGGAGFNVNWKEVEDYMSLPKLIGNYRLSKGNLSVPNYSGSKEELDKIFEMVYGKQKPRLPQKEKKTIESQPIQKLIKLEDDPDYLLIDGYNLIFAWPELKDLAKINIDSAREALIEIVENYSTFTGIDTSIVFDAYKKPEGVNHVEKYGELVVVYTKEAETADMFIEKFTHDMAKKFRVKVVSSDSLEQRINYGHGAGKISSQEFINMIKAAELEIAEIIRKKH
ncbi:MAG: NYN domain-containing protein [Clostridia bacterium]|nr:NYN domain-containing protein [Clostridia bacterium]